MKAKLASAAQLAAARWNGASVCIATELMDALVDRAFNEVRLKQLDKFVHPYSLKYSFD